MDPRTAGLEAIYRNSVFFFVALLGFAFIGFWRSYFSDPLAESDYHTHLHGIAMTLWCLMLIAQSGLIRTDRRNIHRQLGKFSYLLAPVIILSTLSLAHYKMPAEELTPRRLYVLSIQLFLVLQFGLTYGLAIYHRREPMTHARYMICTALPLIDPIFTRIIRMYLLPGSPLNRQVMTYALTDLILILLMIWDWRSHKRLNVFPAMLGAFVILQAPTFFVTQLPFWTWFAEWYRQLPLS